MADDVIDVLDDADVDRAVLMGLSMGGMIAQEVALAAPERVTALCLVATRPPAPKFTPPAGVSGICADAPAVAVGLAERVLPALVDHGRGTGVRSSVIRTASRSL